MANNRMWLKNNRTGKRVLLGTYYPYARWCVFHDDMSSYVDGFFRSNRGPVTQWGDNEYVIEYDVEDEPSSVAGEESV